MNMTRHMNKHRFESQKVIIITDENLEFIYKVHMYVRKNPHYHIA